MIVSIDIGTSYSSICVLGGDGKGVPVDVSTGISVYGSKYSLPSAVFVEEGGDVLLGQAAMNSRMRLPQNFRMEFKRDLGQDIPVILGPRKFLPWELYAEMFRYMTGKAVRAYGEPIEKAYLTYPASYGKKKRQQIEEAAKAAGLFEVDLVDEPTAAAMSFCDGNIVQEGETFLVYDFGGGTFDVSLVRYTQGQFGVLGRPDGLENCGGIDIDRVIYQDMVGQIDREILASVSQNPLNRMRLDSQLAELAVKAKHHLSTAENFKEDIQVGFELIPYELSRSKLEAKISPMVGQTIEVCERVLKAMGLKQTDLSAVFMVGGTSRVPFVRALVERWAGGVRVLSATDLELAVASGALYSEGNKSLDLRMADIHFVEKEAERGNVDACYELGGRYAHGSGIDVDTQQAMAWFEKAAALGHGPSMTSLGAMYSIGTMYARENVEKAAKWYTKAAIAGDAAGQYHLGEMYRTGGGVEKDEEIAQQWITRALGGLRTAAEGNDAEAATMLGYIYKEGRVTPKDDEKSKKYSQIAVELYTGRAEQGELHAQFRLGQLYFEVFSQSNVARRWLRKAAKNHHVFAQYLLGDTYSRGDEAYVKWMTKAAENGHTLAQWTLGNCYAEGEVVSKDMEQAVYWYRKAAHMAKNTEVVDWARERLADLRRQRMTSLVEEFIEQKPFITKGRGEFSEKRIENLKRILNVPATEKIILARDSTFLGNGKNGYVLTDYGIHSKGSFLEVSHVSWGDFINGEIEARTLSKETNCGIYFNGESLCAHVGSLDNQMAAFWPELQVYLKQRLRNENVKLDD